MDKDFLTSSILDGVPDDTQVICLGEDHDNLFHRLYLYLNLPDLARAGYMIAGESGKHLKTATENSLKIGYRPYYFAKDDTPWPENSYKQYPTAKVRFPQICENNQAITEDEKRSMLREYYSEEDMIDEIIELDSSPDYNVFSNFLAASSHYKILRACDCLEIEHNPVDSKIFSYGYAGDPLIIEARNKEISTNITKLAKKNKRILYWGGSAHLYSAPQNGWGEDSVQTHLQRKNIKTHTISLCEKLDDLLIWRNNAGDCLDEIEPEIVSGREWNKNIDDIRNKETETNIHLSDFFTSAGTKMPDKIITFSDNAYGWLLNNAHMKKVQTKPMYEAQAWNKIWNEFGRNAHSIRKKNYKNSSSKSTLSSTPT